MYVYPPDEAIAALGRFSANLARLFRDNNRYMKLVADSIDTLMLATGHQHNQTYSEEDTLTKTTIAAHLYTLLVIGSGIVDIVAIGEGGSLNSGSFAAGACTSACIGTGQILSNHLNGSTFADYVDDSVGWDDVWDSVILYDFPAGDITITAGNSADYNHGLGRVPFAWLNTNPGDPTGWIEPEDLYITVADAAKVRVQNDDSITRKVRVFAW